MGGVVGVGIGVLVLVASGINVGTLVGGTALVGVGVEMIRASNVVPGIAVADVSPPVCVPAGTTVAAALVAVGPAATPGIISFCPTITILGLTIPLALASASALTPN